MQEDNQNACRADVHSKQLDKAPGACLNSNVGTPHISQTKLNSASNDAITNSSKYERQDKKKSEDDEELLNHQEHLVTVDIFADCVSSCQ